MRAKAARSLGLIRRTLGKCNQEVKETAYNTLVRPQLEYATSAWNPHTERNNRIVESVQRQAARFVMHDYHRESSVTDMLNTLHWDTLQTRRLLHQTEMFYHIHCGMVNINPPSEIERLPRPARSLSSHSHNLSYKQPYTRVDCYLYSMYPRAIHVWNRLPVAAVTADSIHGFRRAALPTVRGMMPPPFLKTT